MGDCTVGKGKGCAVESFDMSEGSGMGSGGNTGLEMVLYSGVKRTA
jgi:hypothetical protein